MNITIIITSFIAGILTILAPCVLPLLPVIIGSTASSKNPYKPFIVTASLGISIIFFTLLLKTSTIFITVPLTFWNILSGGIVLLFGLFLLFPNMWSLISIKLGFEQNSQSWLEKYSNKDSIWNYIIIGAALGPVFSSCSPTYFLIIATILPASFLSGLIYLIIYALGLVLTLGLIGYFGQKLIKKVKWASNPEGKFKKIMGVILIIVGLSVMTGFNTVIESKILNSNYDLSSIEQNLFNNIQKTDIKSTKINNYMVDTSNKQIDTNNSLEKYEDYSPEKVKEALTQNYQYAFFFHADWCSTCQYLEKNILENIDQLPEQTVIFKLNYDEVTELKKEYKVLSQSTVIFFNNKGNIIDRKLNPTLERIIQSLSNNTENIVSTEINSKVKESIEKIKNKKNNFSNAKNYYEYLKKNTSLKQATFAGGCFWCLEGPFESEYGVIESFSGYVGGNIENPTYQEVSSGKTGSREAVNIFYDPNATSYESLLEIYWRQIDPTDEGGQFADRGLHYTTAIFYHNDIQKKMAEKYKLKLENSGEFSQIVTKIIEFKTFYLAEEYHQDYYIKSSNNYNNYKNGSGRSKSIKSNTEKYDEIFIVNSKYIKPDEETIKAMLDAEIYAVTQEGATETPFQNKYWDNHEEGIYVDIITGEPLFSSTDKFDSGTGWPSFSRPIDDNFITEKEDNKLIISRTEVKSKTGDSHLGHVFNDGPEEEGGMRYCINSATLTFISLKNMEEQGYGKYLSLFE